MRGSNYDIGEVTGNLYQAYYYLKNLSPRQAEAGDIVCNVLGSVEAGFDPGDACRIGTEATNLQSKFAESLFFESRQLST